MIMIWESAQECPGEKWPRPSGQSGVNGHNARQHVAKVCNKSEIYRLLPAKLAIKIVSVHEVFIEDFFASLHNRFQAKKVTSYEYSWSFFLSSLPFSYSS